MRADLFLSSSGYAKSRTAAARLIESGVTVGGVKIKKPSQDIPETMSGAEVVISDPERYVSRGGLKLEAALDAFGISPKWLVCADIGASTGGFTDCLLQRGAAKVYAVDVGHGQLDKSLEGNPRVISLEGVNAREIDESTLGEKAALVTSDVSFISQEKIYDSVTKILSGGGKFISLIKPQFEAGADSVGKGGIVKDKRAHVRVIETLISAARRRGLAVKAVIPSPIKGGDGNIEYLAYFENGGETVFTDIKKCVDDAFGG